MSIFVLACGSESNTSSTLDTHPVDSKPVALDAVEQLSEIWVCHHPNTKMHGQPCVEDTYPAGCFVPGDTSKFCWILTEHDCNDGQPMSWQRNNCHLLGM